MVMGAIAFFAVFAFPQLKGLTAVNSEEQAKTANNAVLDAIVLSYGRSSASAPWASGTEEADVYAPPAPVISASFIRTLTPDVAVTDDQSQASSNAKQVSVGLRRMQTSSGSQPWWRVGTASLASSSSGTSCWFSWRDLDPPVGLPTENYMVTDMADSDLGLCTGKAAANLVFSQPTAADPPKLGKSWAVPRKVLLPELTLAAATGQ